MALGKLDPSDPETSDSFRKMLGPQQVDEQIRQAIHFCWMSLPADRKNVAEVEKEVRRIMERALKNLRDDADAFGFKT
jgi:hypothetical protein